MNKTRMVELMSKYNPVGTAAKNARNTIADLRAQVADLTREVAIQKQIVTIFIKRIGTIHDEVRE